jgi:hypothetical protein
MAVEISPEPSEEERKAILEALADERAQTAAPSPWRAAGLGPGPEDEEPEAASSPRQSRGATRA